MRHRKREQRPAIFDLAPRPEVRPAASQEDLQIERNRARQIAGQHGLSHVDLRTVTPDPEATALIDERTARALTAIPLMIQEDQVLVAVADPEVEADLRAVLGRQVALQIAAPTDILNAIGNSFRALTGIDSRVKVFEARDVIRKDSSRVDVAAASDEAPVVQVVQLVITQALRDRASDVHIEPHDDRVRVRFRIDGALHDQL
jgi:type IV pilus assembly protein PilB